MKSATKHTIDVQVVEDYAAGCFGVPVAKAEELTDGSYNTAFFVRLRDGDQVVLKIAPPPDAKVMRQEKDLMACEIWAMKLAKSSIDVPMPTVRYEDNGDSNPFGSPCFFMDRVPGVALSKARLSRANRKAVYREVGDIARRINAVTGEYFGYPYDRHTRWSDAMLAVMRNLAADATDAGAALSVPPERIVALFQRYSEELDRVQRPALLHRDLWAGNVFVNPGTARVTGILDWERAMYGDPSLDTVFAMMEGLLRPKVRFAFYEGYGRSAAYTENERIRLELYSVYFYMIMFTEHYYRKNGSALLNMYLNKRMQKTVSALEKQLGRYTQWKI